MQAPSLDLRKRIAEAYEAGVLATPRLPSSFLWVPL